MHGKFGFRDLLSKSKISENEIQDEIIAQIEKFIKLTKRLPTHIDGHQHIHIIPLIAKILSYIMANLYGIYRTRIPIEITGTHSEFRGQVIEDAKISKEIFERNSIISTDRFIGLKTMGENFTILNISKEIEEITKDENVTSIELMCHPGYSGNNWDEFNCSKDRESELKTLLSEEFEDNLSQFRIIKSNFSQLEFVKNMNSKRRILILSILYQSSGNLTTCLRLKDILSKRYDVYIKNNSLDLDNVHEITILKKFIFTERIDLFIGIHAFRSGRLMNSLINIPKIILLSGTDMNSFIENNMHFEIMKKSLIEADSIIGFNEDLKKKALTMIDKEIFVIPQSVDVEKISEFFDIEIPNGRLIILPASLRKVKDVGYCLKKIAILLSEFTDCHFWVLGNILDNEYGEKIISEIESLDKEYGLERRMVFKGLFKREDYLSILQSSFMLLNSSISEGMSCAIQEAFAVGIPVIARKIKGNEKLINDGVNGMLFENEIDFERKFRELLNDSELRSKLIANAKEDANSKYHICIEEKAYFSVIESVFDKCYYKYESQNYSPLFIYTPDIIHKICPLNVQLFQSIQLPNSAVSILDMGCGTGIFSTVVTLNNPQIKRISCSDIDARAIEICKLNSHRMIDVTNNELEFEFYESDMYKSIPKENAFDVILINMPQMPGKVPFRRYFCY